MGLALAVLNSGQVLTTTSAALYTAPALTTVGIKNAVFSNVTAGAITITVNRVPSAGSPTASNQIISAQSIAANSTYLAPELANLVLAPGESIYAKASALTSINAFLSGFTST